MAIICRWRDLSLRFSSGPAFCSAKDGASSSAVECSLTNSLLVALPGGDPAAEEPELDGAGGVLSRAAMFGYACVYICLKSQDQAVGRCRRRRGMCSLRFLSSRVRSENMEPRTGREGKVPFSSGVVTEETTTGRKLESLDPSTNCVFKVLAGAEIVQEKWNRGTSWSASSAQV